MTVIRNNSISGINSITAQSGALNFYDSTGNTLSIGASVSGNITGNVTGPGTSTFDGSVGIGTDNPATKLEVYNSSATPVINIRGPASGSSALEFYSSTTKNGALLVNSTGFLIAADNSNPINFNAGGSERLRITSGGEVQISNGNLVFSTSGTGIDFSATSDGSGTGVTSDNELLDDYEEGTWEPVYNFSTSGDATCVSVGRYIKVGAIVHVQGYVYINNSNSLSGNALIAGLPFAASSSPSQRTSGFVISQARAWPENHPYLRLLLEPNSTAIKLFNNDTSSASNARLTNANFTAAAEKNILSFSGAYTV